MKFKMLGIVCALFYFQGQAQAGVSTSGYWVGIMPTYNITEKQSITVQAEARRQGDNSFTLIRPSYHYQIKSWFNLGLGGDLFSTGQTESRYWGEFNANSLGHIPKQKLHFRLRQEFRELGGAIRSGARTRMMLMSQFDLSEKVGLEAFVFNEVFYIQRSFSGGQNFFDRNWLGFRVRKNHGETFYDLGGFWEKVFNADDVEGFVGILSVGCSFD